MFYQNSFTDGKKVKMFNNVKAYIKRLYSSLEYELDSSLYDPLNFKVEIYQPSITYNLENNIFICCAPQSPKAHKRPYVAPQCHIC